MGRSGDPCPHNQKGDAKPDPIAPRNGYSHTQNPSLERANRPTKRYSGILLEGGIE
jgi:hypothetical protein